MANNSVVGAVLAGSNEAMVVDHKGVDWLEIWRVEYMLNGQWYRNCKVSGLVSEQDDFTAEELANLPHYKASEVPEDFYLPQGSVAQMYQDFAEKFGCHATAVFTARVNYWKARRFAYNIGAWYILRGVKGLLAQFPGMIEPWFFSWPEFQVEMNKRFPIQ